MTGARNLNSVDRLGVLAAICILMAATGAISCGGSKTDLPALATAAADVTPSAALEIRAKGTKFDKDTLVVPAAQEVTLSLDNQDGGTLHNVAVYTGTDAKRPVPGRAVRGQEDTGVSLQGSGGRRLLLPLRRPPGHGRRLHRQVNAM